MDVGAAEDATSGLRSSERPLAAAYDLAMLDLDGVVYIGGDAVPGVAEALSAAARSGMQSAFVTNNASRPPEAVAAHLRRLGVAAQDSDVVTSAQAAARLVAELVPPGAAVFVIGGDGLFVALRERGLVPTQAVAEAPVAVVSGFSKDLRWRTVMDGAILVRSGLPWVASNRDLTVPTPRGPGPGNGVLVDAVAGYAGVQPVVAGKPEPPLFRETVRRVGGRRPLVVGDRLDTDIEGAVRAGYDSLLVMTGVTDLAELVAAPRHRRPSYVGATLAALHRPHERPEAVAGGWRTSGWHAEVIDGLLRVQRLDARGGVPDAWLAAAAAAAWAHADDTGVPVGLDASSQPRTEDSGG